MNPTEPKKDNSLSSFTLGLAVGVIGALLIGTEEGRKLAKEAYDTLPEKYRKIPESFFSRKDTSPETPPQPIIEPMETPHHTTFTYEAPPPPPPAVKLTRPS